MKRQLTSLFALLAAFVLVSTAMCQAPTYTSPEEAGIDFTLQGEYVTEPGADGQAWGVQVIALGHGEFRAVGYPGGLPGDGWKGDDRHPIDGKLDGKVARFQDENVHMEVDGKTITVRSPEGELYSQGKKVERKSPTLGAKPPQGAVVLFDGSNTDAWENAKIVMDELLGATNCQTKQKFGDHQIHLEFRLPFMPESRGQGRGNSGMYVQGRYEVQVLDSFGLEGKDNECGGIYQISAPEVNMCFPPLTWQTYDVEFKAARYDDQGNKVENARITVRHNGVVIQDDLELPRATPGRFGEGPDPGPLFLQDHGNPVVFRNIWVVEQP